MAKSGAVACERTGGGRGLSVAGVADSGVDRVFHGCEVLAGPDEVLACWFRVLVDGVHRPDLDGCLDVDIAATPLTNTFPIRRLARLSVGQVATSPVAWVDVPGLGTTRVDQTYRRLTPVDGRDAWEYGDPLHGAFTLTVDDDGLVVDYECFARRVHG